MNPGELFDKLTTPSERLLSDMEKIEGDILIIGAGGKIGPSLAVLAKKASDKCSVKRKVIAASLFDNEQTVSLLKRYGIEVIDADLLDAAQLDRLPEAQNIIFMAGRKFGTSGNQPLTWAINVLLPAAVARRYPGSNIVAFSTGNVYGMRPVTSGGALENETLCPVGEYAQSCLGRERVLTYWSEQNKTPMLMLRLNYAIDLRYGVLYDIANTIMQKKPVDLSIGYVNCIWQGDAAEFAIRSLLHCSAPPNILNVTGPECISVQYIAEELGRLLGLPVQFTGAPPQTSLFSNAGKMAQILGYPSVPLNSMLEWTARWVAGGGEVIDAPTHFEQRDGNY